MQSFEHSNSVLMKSYEEFQTKKDVQYHSRHLVDKINGFLVICIYKNNQNTNDFDQRLKRYQEEGLITSIPVFDNAENANSYVIWEETYKENKPLFIELRLASRNELISKVAEGIVMFLVTRYKKITSTHHPVLKNKNLTEQAIGGIKELLKKETFFADDLIWEEFCDWFRLYLMEWVLEEMAYTVGFERMETISEHEINSLFYEYITKNLKENVDFQTKFTYIVNRNTCEWVEKVISLFHLDSSSIETINHLLNYNEASILPKKGLLSATKDYTFNMAIQDHILVMNNNPYHSVREAIYKKDFQTPTHSPWPTTPIIKGKSEGYIQIYPQTKGNVTQESDLVRLAWDQVKTLSDLDVDVFDSLCSIYLSKARKSEEFIEIHLDELLIIRGLKPKLGGDGRRGGFESKQRGKILQSLSLIRNLLIQLDHVTVYRNGKPVQTSFHGRTFLFKNSHEWDSPIGNTVNDFVISYSVDPIFAQYLKGTNRQVALLSMQALRYDPYRQNWEKRLARYLSWRWRTQARKGNFLQPNKIRTLIESIGKTVDQRSPSRTRERFEKALDLLVEDKVIASWHYEKWDESIADHKGWARIWMNSLVLIEPPDVIKEQYHSIEKKGNTAAGKSHLMTQKDHNHLGVQIREKRKCLHLSLSELSEELNISASYISGIERGIKNPSSQIRSRLHGWLESFNVRESRY